jgi:ATP-dependent RNA circularization protein (DNA/RNA ligase family)
VNEYHKIQTVFLRDPETKHKTLLYGAYALPEFEFLANNQWIFTEKVDGTNIRVIIPQYTEDNKAYGINFGGKTDNAQIPTTLLQRLQERFLTTTQRQMLAEIFPSGACLYGEGYGAKIQKAGANYRQDQDFVLFDVKVGDWWLQREDVEDVAQKLNLDIVPIIGKGTLPEMIQKTKTGFQSIWGNFPAEGIVARPSTELNTRNNKRIITKIKHKDFR